MSRRPLTSEETKVRNWLLSGKSVSATASMLRMGKTKINKIIETLIYFGELVEEYEVVNGVVKSFNPRLFRAPSDSTPVKERDPPKGGSVSESDGFGASKEIMDPRTGRPTLETVGVSTDSECPEGYGEAHLSGFIAYTVNAVGECDRLVDDRGYTIGTVPDAVKVVGRGGQQRTGILRLFNQEITFDWRWFPTTGNQFLYLKLGRLFFDPKVYSDPADIRALFIQRARFVEYALAINGWVLTRSEKEISGQMHVAWENHPLCRHFDPDYQDSNGDLTVDTSKGVPELEMEHTEDPLFSEKLRIMSNLPTRIMDIEANAGRTSASVDDLFRELQGLRAVVEEVISTMSRMSEAQAMQLECSARQLQISTNLMKVQTNDTNIRLMRTQQSLDDFVRTSDSDRREVKASRDNLEGYL